MRFTKSLLTVVFALFSALYADAEPRPNIILVYVDDLAYGDLGAFGCPDIPTPHIDSLAETGIKLTNYHTAAAACSPSRVALMTGLYPQRFGKYALNRGQPIPRGHPTLAETLRKAGYRTATVGADHKWDIGSWTQGPLDVGFEEMPLAIPASQAPIDKATGGGPNYMRIDGSYLTENEGDQVVEFIGRTARDADPFFLYYTPLAVHCPLTDVPQRYLDRVPENVEKRGGRRDGKPTEKNYRRYLAATLIALDDQIGRMLDELDECGLRDDTLIVFTSDNGGNPYDGARPDPYRGGKHNEHVQWAGYLQLPAIVSWPGTLPEGTMFDGLVSSLDWYPTLAAVAEAPPVGGLDGIDLLPLLAGDESSDPDRALVWELHAGSRTTPSNTPFKAVRWKQWRAIDFMDQGWRLYDLENDPAERHDLAAKHPEILAEMRERFRDWRGRMAEPVSKVARGGRIPHGFGWITLEEWKKVRDEPERWSRQAVRDRFEASAE